MLTNQSRTLIAGVNTTGARQGMTTLINQIITIALTSFIAYNFSRISYHGGMIGNIEINVGERSNQYIITDFDIPHNDGIFSDNLIIGFCIFAIAQGEPIRQGIVFKN